jgi:hypothetical protein
MYLRLAWLEDGMTFPWYLILVIEINHLFDTYITSIRKDRMKTDQE